MKQAIEKTAAAVRRWRNNHPDRAKDLPTDLQQRIVKLLETHSWDEVCETVEVTRCRLATWRRHHREDLQLKRRPVSRRRAASAPQPSEADFIELPLLGAAPGPHDDDGITVELELPSGVVLRAHSRANAAALAELVAAVVAKA